MVARHKLISALPVLIGGILVFSGFQKAYNGSGINRTLLFDGFPVLWISPLVWFIVQAEIVIGLALLLGIAKKAITMAGIALLMIYAGQLAFLLFFREPPNCGCLGALEVFKNARHEALFGLVRNLMFIAALLVRYHSIRVLSCEKEGAVD
jgi:uncharacterized membrane protein YphA (DoxX/SURF4 family)